ncbi:MAG TPA: energy transducer TonB [Candidatus Acidoferrales bacterium]|nr:energy transducer TonB [Candidatus Acidoferrales bacterium]
MHDLAQHQNEPRYARDEMALGRCLVEGDPEAMSQARRRSRKALGLSITIEFVLLVLLVATPLFTSVAQPQLHQVPPGFVFLGSWHGSKPSRGAEHATTTRPQIIHDVFLPPVFTTTVKPSQSDEEPVEISSPNLGYLEISGAFPTGNVRVPPPVEPPHVEVSQKPHQQQKHSVKMSEGVLQARLISRVEPRYPVLARQSRQQGTVVLHAIISRDGRINSLEVVSGPPLFVQAALDAVRQWRYLPTMLNGEPVEVETTITVVFQLQP